MTWTRSTYCADSTCVEARKAPTMNTWTRSTRCGSSACVEVAEWTHATPSGSLNCVEAHTHNTEIHVRDSKNPDGPYLTFTHTEWNTFTTAIRNGEFADL